VSSLTELNHAQQSQGGIFFLLQEAHIHFYCRAMHIKFTLNVLAINFLIHLTSTNRHTQFFLLNSFQKNKNMNRGLTDHQQ